MEKCSSCQDEGRSAHGEVLMQKKTEKRSSCEDEGSSEKTSSHSINEEHIEG